MGFDKAPAKGIGVRRRDAMVKAKGEMEAGMDRRSGCRTPGPTHRKLRLLTVSVLVVMFVFALSGIALADVWTDISDGTWQSDYQVTAAQAATVAQGFQDGTFQPYLAVTRGQFAKMVADGLHVPYADPSVPTFSDVPPDSLFYQQIEGCVSAGIISGYDDGTFGPNDTISRQQATSILGLWLSQKEIAATGGIQGKAGVYDSLAAWFAAEGDGVLGSFADQAQVSPAHRPAVAYLALLGIVVGSTTAGGTYLKPLDETTRVQAVVMCGPRPPRRDFG